MGSVQAQRQLRQEMLRVYRQHIVYRIYHVGLLSVVNLFPLYQFPAVPFYFWSGVGGGTTGKNKGLLECRWKKGVDNKQPLEEGTRDRK